MRLSRSIKHLRPLKHIVRQLVLQYRTSSMSLKNDTIKSNLLEQQCQMTFLLLACRLLKYASLSEQHEQLAKTTVSDLKYD